MSITFRESDHTYWTDEPDKSRRLPSVTQILKDCGLIYYPPDVNGVMQRGTAVHKACELLDKGTLDWDTVDPRITGYIKAYQKFTADLKPEWELIEQVVGDETSGYAGTLDRLGKVKGVRWLVDLKTGRVQDWTALQLMAYALGLQEHPEALVRVGVELKESGDYRLTRFDNHPGDCEAWSACLTLYNWKQEHG